MLHLLHPALSRAAALDPYRFRHRALVASASLVALGLLLSTGVNSALATATAAETEQRLPQSQLFTAAAANAGDAVATAAANVGDAVAAADSVTEPAPARETFTVDVRPALLYPVGAGAPVGSPFGPREQACDACSTLHQGVDWNPGRGTTIVAIADGVISKIGEPGNSLGVYVTIDHVVNGQPITSVYGHMEEGSMPYSVGDFVRGGDPVGRVGSTGVTTAPHLHFEIRVGGTAINPVPWMAANGAQ